MAHTIIAFLLLVTSFQAYAAYHFPQLKVRGGLSDILATPTPTLRPQLRLKRFDNGTTTTSLDPDNSPDPTPDTTTILPVFVPPTTTISGAAETTAAKQIGPIIFALWQNRNLLNDDNTKQQYIDQVDNVKNDVTNLFNNLDNKPDPPSQCCQTSLKKRSLISGIGDLLKTAADIVSCAECVVNNLDNIVKDVPPDVDVVDTLTDTLNDLKTKLDDLDDDDQNSQSQSQSQSKSSESSGCTSATVTDCTVDLYESTTFFVTDGSTTSAVATSSSTNCHTVTACSATPTTETTTIATTATSSGDDTICAKSNCGDSCNAKRSVETQAPLPPTYPFPEINPEDFFPYLNSTSDEKLAERSLLKRDIPGGGTGDWSDFYNNLRGLSSTTVVDINSGVMGTTTAAEEVSFNTGQQNIMVEGLFGCTSVIIVDHRGAFVNHIWEDDALANFVPQSQWESYGPDLLSNYLTTYAGNTFTSQAQAWIMAGSKATVDNTGVVDPNNVDNPINQANYPTAAELTAITSQGTSGLRFSDKTNELAGIIQSKLGITPTIYEYRRQTVQQIRALGGAFGKAAVLYDPAQSTNPDDNSAQPANTGAWKVYIQADPVGQALWSNKELQIWRVNLEDGGNQESANVLHIGNVGDVVDPCGNDLNPPVPDSETLNPGNPIIDVGPHAVGGSDDSPQPFDVQDDNGNDVLTGCTFTGTGVYAPTADSGLQAGTLQCDGGYSVQCNRPYNNQATTCGNQALSDCDQGQLGSTCFPYYQLLATCRI